MRFTISARSMLATIIVALLISACASDTKLSSDWTNPNVSNPHPLKKVAVFVIAKDESVRRYAEDQMAAKMPAGVTSVAGYTMFDKPEKNVSKVRETLAKNGFDGALVTRLVRVDETEQYVPSQTIVQQTQPFYGPAGAFNQNPYSFDNYYGSTFNSTYVTTTESYTINNTNVIVETKLYRLPDAVLLWSGTTDTLNPNVKSEMVDAITKIVEAEISQDGLLGGSK